jgi:hypothetical protein
MNAEEQLAIEKKYQDAIKDAIDTIHRLVEASTTVGKQINSTRGPSKTVKREEVLAAKAVFHLITGVKASDIQVEEMTYL